VRCRELLARASLIVHAGDFTASSVLSELEEIGPVVAVRGNMDDEALRRRLPAETVVVAEGVRIGIVHDGGAATGRHDRLRRRFPGCDVVVYGHSHLPEVARAGDMWVVNPGSPTERRRAPSHTMAVLERGRPDLVIVDP
jgi:putative phosphoesterase